MKNVVVLTGIMVVLCSLIRAQHAGVNPYPPGPFPDRVILNVTPNPSESLAVNWRTHDRIASGIAEIKEATANPAAPTKVIKVMAKTTTVPHRGIVANYHSAVFDGLKAQTRYMYRVGSGDFWSEWVHVKTAAHRGDPLSFLFLGDVQQGMRTFWPGVIREAYKQMPEANMILYAGDIVNRGFNDHEWGELFYGGDFIHRSIPAMMTPGNHEHADNEQGVNELTPLWRAQFSLPQNGPEGLEETCYYTDIQGVRFISLNTQAIWFGGAAMQKQIQWLEQLLTNNPNKWTCVLLHHPVYSVKSNRDNKNLRENFQPLFNKYKVDLVLQGHDHAYGRGKEKIPMPVNGDVSPTTYVVSMSGSKMYADDQPAWADRSGAHLQLYQLVTIEKNTLTFCAYTVTGEKFDGFKLVKRKKKNNKIIHLKLKSS